MSNEKQNKDEKQNKIDFTQNKEVFSKKINTNFFTRVTPEVGKQAGGARVVSSSKKNIDSDTIEDLLSSYKNQKSRDDLLELSENLYSTSRHYQLLIQYYADMPLWSYTITANKDVTDMPNAESKREYFEVATIAKQMNMKQEFVKVLQGALMRDTFFGYVYKTRNGYYIQRFDNSMCKITSMEDGVYNFAIDMSTFERDERVLEYYPESIQSAYHLWKKEYDKKTNNNKKISSFVELDPKNTICVKINEAISESVPPFSGVFDALYEIKGFKQSRKNQENLNNYMLLLQKIPLRDSNLELNDFQLDQDAVTYFHNLLTSVLPDNIGAITTPMNIEPIRFDRDRIDIDNVSKSERDFWKNAGVSQSLFSSDNTTSEGIRQSIKVDENTVFNFMKQLERWLNRFIYLNSTIPNVSYGVNLLKVTSFNQDSMYKMFLENATYGLPVKSHLGATIGLEPLDMMNMLHIENDVFSLDKRLVPLASSHTMSTNAIVDENTGEVEIGLKNPSGRPSNKDSGNVNSDNTDKTENIVD